MIMEAISSFPMVWRQALKETLECGVLVAPRGRNTLEIMQRTIAVNMCKPVLTVPLRNMNYKFMAAEAYWILTGDDRVETIAPYNSRISEFSDDGVKFFGAYGPKIISQLQYVVDKLIADPDSRQAGLTIWRENPPATKDYPCTVAIFCNIRDGKLNLNVFMRSSDLWLGVPYDVFNFSMLAHFICCKLNEQRTPENYISPGTLFLTAASSHLYEHNCSDARICVNASTSPQNDTPELLWQNADCLMTTLKNLRETRPGNELRWWEVKS
jgi:thymidylate synthase